MNAEHARKRCRQLAGLSRLLSEGALPWIAADRTSAGNDEEVLRPGSEFALALGGIAASQSGKVDGNFATAREKLMKGLEHDPAWVRAVVFSPHRLLCLSCQVVPSGGSAIAVWTAAATCADAVWEFVSAPPSGMSTGTGAEWRKRLLPAAARVRFLLLSYPFRHRGEEASDTWNATALGIVPEAGPDSPGSALPRVFGGGQGSWPRLVRAARESRDAWLGCLDAFPSHPLLVQVPARCLEEEVRALAFRDGERSGPLALSERPLNQPAPPSAADEAVVHHVVERHLLPRFALGAVMRTTWWRKGSRAWILAGCAIAVLLTALVMIVVFACTGTGALLWCAVASAALFYLLLVAGHLAHGPLWSTPWLLRLPAAAAVGLIPLIALNPYWWQNIHTDPRAALTLTGAALVLLVASCGYLLVESVNHNAGIRRHGLRGAGPPSGRTGEATRPGRGVVPAVRAAAVATIGFAHSLLVAVIGVVLLAPVFAENGRELIGILDQGGKQPPLILLFAAAWCLFVGVFSQTLWEDRPITAPLAHTRWRNER